jgi:hypothetical protein
MPGDASEWELGSALRRVLDDLGLVDRRAAARAVRRVRGTWWRSMLYTRRSLDIGQNGAPIHPWLVPGTDDELHDERGPLAFADPCVQGSESYSLRIVPSYWMIHRLRRSAPATPRIIDARRDFGPLMEVIRSEVTRKLGADAISPN